MSGTLDRLARALGSFGGGTKRKADVEQQGAAEGPPSKKPTHRRIVFRPWDQKDMLNRLETFRPLTWFSKPDIVGPIACASRGYYNEARDQLCCEFCGVRLLYPQVPYEARPRAAALFAEQLATKHEAHCPWRSTRSDESVLAFVPDACPAATPHGLRSSYHVRLQALESLDALPQLYPRAVQRLAAAAASSAASRNTTKLGRASPGVPGLAKVLGLPPRYQNNTSTNATGAFPGSSSGNSTQQGGSTPPTTQGGPHTPARPQITHSTSAASTPNTAAAAAPAAAAAAAGGALNTPEAASSAFGSGAGISGFGSGAGLVQAPPPTLTFMQRARALALLGWEVEELLVPEGAGSAVSSAVSSAMPHALPMVYWPSSSAYTLAHLTGAPSSGQASCHTQDRPPKRRLCMQNVALKCPICKSRVGLWNFVPKAQPPSAPSQGTPSAKGAAVGPQPPPAPLASLFKTIAGGTYGSCAPGVGNKLPSSTPARFGSDNSSRPAFGLSALSQASEEANRQATTAEEAAGPSSVTDQQGTSAQGAGTKRKAEADSTGGPSTSQAGTPQQQEGPHRKQVRTHTTHTPSSAATATPTSTAGRGRGRVAGPSSSRGAEAGQPKQPSLSPTSGPQGSGRGVRAATAAAPSTAPSAAAAEKSQAQRPATPGGGSRRSSFGGGLEGGSGGAAEMTFDPLSYHRSWCPWVFIGHSDGHAPTPESPHSPPHTAPPRVKCGWMYLLDALCAPPQEMLAPLSISSPRASGSVPSGGGLGSPQASVLSPASRTAAAGAVFMQGAAGVGGGRQAGGEGTSQQQQQEQQVQQQQQQQQQEGSVQMPGNSVEVERLLEDTSHDRKDMRALKESILHNLRRK